MGGILFSSKFTAADLRDRFIEGWLRLRFYSPLIAASIVRDLHFQGFGSWIYNPVTYNQAQDWASKTFFFHDKARVDDATVNEFIQTKLLETIPYKGSGIDAGFFGHLLVQEGGHAALLVHSTHSHLDGPGG
jgi:hypothetical protein